MQCDVPFGLWLSRCVDGVAAADELMKPERENGEPRFRMLLARVAAKQLPPDCLNAKVLWDARQSAQLQCCAVGTRNTARLRTNETAGSQLGRRAKHGFN